MDRVPVQSPVHALTRQVATYLYPWDIVDDEAAAEGIAALGVQRVSLAAAYHATRAITPRHRRHRIVTAAHSAAYYASDATRWRGRRIRPLSAPWVDGPDSFGAAAESLAAAGIAVDAWVVLTHQDLPDTDHRDLAVRNAHGDEYPWALCPNQSEVQDYLTGLVAEIAEQSGVHGLELEACGWYGLEHGSCHDKTGQAGFSAAQEFLFSLCFCQVCTRGYAGAGIEPERLRQQVIEATDQTLQNTAAVANSTNSAAELLDTGLYEAVLQYRSEIARKLRRQIVDAARRASKTTIPILLSADLRQERTGGRPGVDPTAALSDVDGLLIGCGDSPEDVRNAIKTAAAACAPGDQIAASITVVGASSETVPLMHERTEAAAQAGANRLHLYHAGLATERERDVLKQLAATWHSLPPSRPVGMLS